MRQYEMMVILDPDVEERTVAGLLEKLVAVVPAEGGTIDKTDIWGRRRMTFEINKKQEGIYAVLDFTCDVATAKELDRQLGLNETVLRTKILRRDAK